ncbi:MAG: hypothetical protein IIT65_15685, partial [Lachnospiraceae bacterium]|nr:hypothetical protein [Lachnospiraceae bacterium]
MKYYSGMFALTQYANPDEHSRGIGDRVDEFYEKRDEYLKESDESKLGTYGIFETDIVPYGGTIMCASHERVYLDFIVSKDFDTLKDLYDYAYNDLNVLHNIFNACSYFNLYSKGVVKFLNWQFGSNFRSYLMYKGNDDLLKYIMPD